MAALCDLQNRPFLHLSAAAQAAANDDTPRTRNAGAHRAIKLAISAGQAFNSCNHTEMGMTSNISGNERSFRVIAGFLILGLFFVLAEGYRWWALLGLIPLLSGLVGWCAVYSLFGIRPGKQRQQN